MSNYSWWKVQQFGVNENNDEGQVFYYNHKGTPIKSPPFKKAMIAFTKRNEREDNKG